MINKYFDKLLYLSKKALKHDEMPVAALIVKNNKIICTAYNTRNKSKKTINHAEIIAITKANRKTREWRLNNCTLYVTMEPCDMCKSVIKESRIEQVYYLMPRSIYKKQHNKTDFENYQINEYYLNKYKIILNKFWKNKR